MARKSRKNPEPVAPATFQRHFYNAAAYIRLSVEDNHKKGDSVETQKSIIQDYLDANPELRLHDYYIDNGTTGTNFARPAFQKMLADAENGIINCVIVKDFSRFGRNMIDTGYYIEKYLPSLKVRFIAITDSFDSSDIKPGDAIILPLKGMINEAYALDIGRKIKAQQRQAMLDGEYIGGRPPYGYLKHPQNCHKLVVDPLTAPVVKQIFQWAYKRAGLNDITRRLNEAGILTPSFAKKAAGLITHENLMGNGKWQTFTVAKILSCETYTGDLVQGKSKGINRRQQRADASEWIIVRGTHEAIVSRELFEAVQILRKQAADEYIGKTKKPYTPNIYKGKIFCGYCGKAMHRQRGWKRKGEQIYVFHCLSNSRVARGSCKAYCIPEDELTAALLAIIQKQAYAVIGKSLILRKNQPATEARRSAAKADLAAVKRDADKYSRMLKSLYESLVSGVITADEYQEMRSDYENKVVDRMIRAKELENSQIELEKRMSEFFVMFDLAAKANSGGDVTAELVDKLIERIRVFADRHIEVDFRFNCGFEDFFENGLLNIKPEAVTV
ncbi:MAG: recombinase family protein [Clostridiales bacterium]|jgi:DNA invertase Pin-like site-specific DNA recombinase/uncharacterized protein YeeX (DUF496 family)|nr:recombinase family protein [Clostridiales bacterium]